LRGRGRKITGRGGDFEKGDVALSGGKSPTPSNDFRVTLGLGAGGVRGGRKGTPGGAASNKGKAER